MEVNSKEASMSADIWVRSFSVTHDSTSPELSTDCHRPEDSAVIGFDIAYDIATVT